MNKEYVDFSWMTFDHFLIKNKLTRKKFIEITGVSDAVLRTAEKNKKINKKWVNKISEHFDIHDVISPEVTKKITRYNCLASLNVNMKITEIRYRVETKSADSFQLDPNTLYCDKYRLRCCLEADNLKDAMDTFMDLIKEYL